MNIPTKLNAPVCSSDSVLRLLFALYNSFNFSIISFGIYMGFCLSPTRSDNLTVELVLK